MLNIDVILEARENSETLQCAPAPDDVIYEGLLTCWLVCFPFPWPSTDGGKTLERLVAVCRKIPGVLSRSCFWKSPAGSPRMMAASSKSLRLPFPVARCKFRNKALCRACTFGAGNRPCVLASSPSAQRLRLREWQVWLEIFIKSEDYGNDGRYADTQAAGSQFPTWPRNAAVIVKWKVPQPNIWRCGVAPWVMGIHSMGLVKSPTWLFLGFSLHTKCTWTKSRHLKTQGPVSNSRGALPFWPILVQWVPH